MSDLEVHMGELKIAKDPDNLIALGIGSCIIITFADPKLKIGALAHTMLPDSKKAAPSENPIKFADTAVDVMLKEMRKNGSLKQDIEAKIIGGANMFPNIEHGDLKPGEDNIASVRKKLKKESIRLVGEAVGGTSGRSIEFSTVTGIVTIKIKL